MTWSRRAQMWLGASAAGTLLVAGTFVTGAVLSEEGTDVAIAAGPGNLADPSVAAADPAVPSSASVPAPTTTAPGAASPAPVPVSAPGNKQPGVPVKSDPLEAVINNQPTGLPESGAGSLQRKSKHVGVSFATANTSAKTRQLIENYGEIRSVSDEPPVITAWVAPEDIPAITEHSVIKGASAMTQPLMHRDQENSAQVQGNVGTRAGIKAACSPLASEANSQLLAAVTSKARGLDGTGLTIGVLSDSYNATAQDDPSATTAAQDVAAGALPGPGNPCGYTHPVQVISVDGVPQEYSGADAINEGRAMLQLIHSVAPGAKLLFATAYNGQLGFADNIRALAAQGADIIVDDIGYFQEPVFQEGVISAAISDVTANGAVYFSSVGNTNPTVGGKQVGSWEAPAYRATTCPSMTDADGAFTPTGDCLDFDPVEDADNTYEFSLKAGRSGILGLQWNQPWGGVTADLDFYVINSSNQVVANGISDSTTSCYGEGVPWSCPSEFLSLWNDGASTASYRIVVNRFSGSVSPRLKLFWVSVSDSSLASVEYPDSADGDIVGPTAFGHSTGVDTLSVAAVPYNSTTTPEAFTSPGPATYYWEPVIDGSIPAAGLASPIQVNRPDFAATDGDCTTFFYQSTAGGSSCPYRFYGTSASAPNAAAVAALVLDAKNDVTSGEMRTLLSNTASVLTNGSPAWSGSGLINAQAAVNAVIAGAPGVPTGLSATGSSSSVSLSWTAPSASGSSSLAGYRVQRSRDGGQTWSTILSSTQNSTATSASDSSVQVGSSYSYRVSAINATNKGLPTDAQSVMVPVPPVPPVVPVAPSAPTSVSASPVSAGAVSVSWQAGSNGGSAITGYTVTASPGGASCTSASTSCTISGLINGTSYRFVVVAANAVGSSPASSQSAAVAPQGAAQKVKGSVVKKLKRSKKASLPASSNAGQRVAWTTSTKSICTVKGTKVTAKKKTGTCKLVARAAANTQYNAMSQAHKIKIVK